MLVSHDLTYRPTSRQAPLWPPLQLNTDDARLVLLSGDSGSGKSSLLRIICGLLPGFRGGKLSGRISVLGCPTPRQPNGRINLLFQNTDAMLHSPRVADELSARAGAAKSRDTGNLTSGWLAGIVEQLNLGGLLDRKIVELSGGQQQRVAFAATLATRPEVVLLDEPTSNLDSRAAEALLKLVVGCAERLGMRFIAAEHNADHLRNLVDGAIRLGPRGATCWYGDRGEITSACLPTPLDLNQLNSAASNNPFEGEPLIILTCKHLSCVRGGRRVLDDINFNLRKGEIVGLTGPNGAGKSTLLLVLAGALKPQRDTRITWQTRSGTGRKHDHRHNPTRVGLLLQNPLHQLFCDTVRDEVALAAENVRHPNVTRQVDELLNAADLASLASRVTLSLSYGEQQRTALAASMSAAPPVVLLDEPTHGMDTARLERLITFIIKARATGTAFIIASHDRTLLEAFSDRVMVLDNGRFE